MNCMNSVLSLFVNQLVSTATTFLTKTSVHFLSQSHSQPLSLILTLSTSFSVSLSLSHTYSHAVSPTVSFSALFKFSLSHFSLALFFILLAFFQSPSLNLTHSLALSYFVLGSVSLLASLSRILSLILSSTLSLSLSESLSQPLSFLASHKSSLSHLLSFFHSLSQPLPRSLVSSLNNDFGFGFWHRLHEELLMSAWCHLIRCV